MKYGLKSPEYVPFWANFTNFDPKSDTPVVQ